MADEKPPDKPPERSQAWLDKAALPLPPEPPALELSIPERGEGGGKFSGHPDSGYVHPEPVITRRALDGEPATAEPVTDEPVKDEDPHERDPIRGR